MILGHHSDVIHPPIPRGHRCLPVAPGQKTLVQPDERSLLLYIMLILDGNESSLSASSPPSPLLSDI